MLVTEYKIKSRIDVQTSDLLSACKFHVTLSYISLVRDSPHYLRMIFYQEKATESESA